MSGVTEIFTKPIALLSLADLACVALAGLLVWAVSLVVHGFYLGVKNRWREY